MENKQFNIFLPKLPDQQCGQLYGFINKTESKTGERSCNYTNVYIKSFSETAGLHLLGTFRCDADQKLCHQQPSSSEFWIELESSKQSIVSISKLVCHSVDVPHKNILLCCYDTTLDSEVLDQNNNFKSSTCLIQLCSGTKPTSAEINCHESLPELQDSATTLPRLSQISKVVERFSVLQLQWRVLSECTSKIGKPNLIMTVLIDFLLGILMVYLFYQYGGTTHTIELLLSPVKEIVDIVENLIEWLAHAPVFGLNPLSDVLKTFSIYHISLWRIYIDILKPVTTFVIFVASITSCIGGFTFLTALLSDLISVASLHFYCCYVYTTRLYSLAKYGLLSTLRRYKGNENLITPTYDDTPLDISQLLLGTIIFCVLLFLFPTAFVFHIVFLWLRIGVLIVKGSLQRLNWLMNAFPCATFICWMCNSNTVAGEIRIEVVPHSSSAINNKHNTIRIQHAKLPLFETLRLTANPTLHPFPRTEWFEMFKKLVAGELI